jgi:hypothetical protein
MPAIPAAPTLPAVPAIPPPLGLPAGSVRAVLALIMSSSIWYLALKDLTIPDILVESVLLVIGFYFGVRAGTVPSLQALATPAPPGTAPAVKVKQPLHLPRGSVRVVLLFGFFGVIAYEWYHSQDLPGPFILILQVLTSYLIGYVSSVVVHRRRMAGKPVIRAIVWFHNLNAVAVMGLVGYVCGSFLFGWPHLFGTYMENLLAWAVAYYFGSRLPS